MKKPSITDIRVMANLAAQKILNTHCVVRKDNLLPEDMMDEHQLTGVIAQALTAYFE